MGVAEILMLIKGVLEFPQAILSLVKLLRASPQERHEQILKKIAEEAQAYEESGRPNWTE